MPRIVRGGLVQATLCEPSTSPIARIRAAMVDKHVALIADYFVVRRTRLDLAGLYRKDGPYWYASGFNPIALAALVAGIAPCVPGFLATVAGVAVAPVWVGLYHYAWFLSFGVSFVLYAALMALRAPHARRSPGPPGGIAADGTRSTSPP